MDFKEEAIRLAGSKRMEKDFFVKDIEMALENAANSRLKAVEDKLKMIRNESKRCLALSTSQAEIVKTIFNITTDYFEAV